METIKILFWLLFDGAARREFEQENNGTNDIY